MFSSARLMHSYAVHILQCTVTNTALCSRVQYTHKKEETDFCKLRGVTVFISRFALCKYSRSRDDLLNINLIRLSSVGVEAFNIYMVKRDNHYSCTVYKDVLFEIEKLLIFF